MTLHEYKDKVLSGEIIASQWVIKACKRFDEDMTRDDLEWREDKADKIIRFYEKRLNHIEGTLVGQPIILAGFQKFILGNLYGWYKNNIQRFNTAYIQTARKNAKTILVGGMGVYDLAEGDDPTPQILVGANNEDQAKICTNAMGRLCQLSHFLSHRIEENYITLHTREKRIYAVTFEDGIRMGTARSMSRDFLTKDGFAPSKTIIDEYHAAVSDDLKNVAESGSALRENPQTLVITTPGYNKAGVCYTKDRMISIKVLDKILEDDHHFTFIAEPDDHEKAEAGDEREWVKGNPLMYHEEFNTEENSSKLMLNNLRRMHTKAVNEGGSKLVDFLIKNMGLWMDSDDTFIPSDKFKANYDTKHHIKDLEGKEYYGGLDLSSDNDLTSFAKFYPNAYGDIHACIIKTWVPEETINKKADYFKFEKEGWLNRTEGNVLHSSRIFEEIRQDVEGPGFQYLCFDRFLSTSIDQLVDEGVQCVKMGQGYLSMNAPMRELYRMFMTGNIEHYGNGLLGWCVSNVRKSTDPAGNIKPDKSKSFEKIDCFVALIMAVNAWMIRNEIKGNVSTEILIGN